MNNSETHLLLNDQIILISGAGGDIGASVAIALAAHGARLILVDKEKNKLEEISDKISATGKTPALSDLNLINFEKVAGAGMALLERFGRLDGVIACHGIRATPTPLGHIAKKEWETVFNNNVTAMWQLIQMTQPLLKKTSLPPARFIGLTCAAAHETTAMNASYNVAKAANEALLKTFQNEQKNKSIHVILADPGELLTRTRRMSFPSQKTGDAPKAHEIASHFVDLMAADAATLPLRATLS